jgi:signal peptidase I
MIIKIVVAVVAFFILCKIMFPFVEVCGCSMFPTYKDGEKLFTKRIFFKRELQKDDVVVYIMPVDGGKKPILKRIAEVKVTDSGEVLYYCLGDNATESYDSRYYGYIPSAWMFSKPFNQRRCENSESSNV